MKSWYLLYCKRGEQQRAKLHLENQSLNCYYPEVEIEKVVRGSRKTLNEPLFPSYVFIQFDEEVGPSFTTIRSTRGVVDFVRFGGLPTKVPDTLIIELKKIENHNDVVSTLPKAGDVVQVSGGQFSGFDAIYKESDGEKRSILLVTLINQQVKVQISNSDITWDRNQ
ncbi:transcription/translation regulatory transformer protein RfaH [Vibrio sp. S17_S38]|uniref:transcription/translation regulatory transformer protein RfaH n=1 Tax=Vibrio sp. S17_S38 TaxID=2720229 RepID=UPI001681973B|nr:transcription/translation regulatory transformer protein RfaH [Vibrio sp. S17_S38]MBD1571871.1 transcription/translation regulatory transformer protein RfaH [Vibrio sp. S17_S38]